MLETLTGKAEKVRGGEVVARMLAAEGVRAAFGIIDGTYFGLIASLEPHGIALYTPRHETSAVHMAGAYARVTGGLGVCMASNGPGVANALGGIAVENAEGNRVLLITSARREGTIDPDRGGTYQSFPQVEVTAPMTKWSCRVPEFGRLAEILRRALRLSWSGRPGVVHVDIPESILNGEFTVAAGSIRAPHQYRSTAPLHPAPELVERAADLLVAAEKPMIHAGSGVIHAGASAELARVAELLHAPVCTSWGARAALSELPGYAVPIVYTDLVTRTRREADCVLALGTRLGETDMWGKAPYWRAAAEQRFIQVDVDEETLGVNRAADLAILACAKVFLRQLAAALEKRRAQIDISGRRAWLAGLQDERAAARARLDRHLADRDARPMCTAQVPDACRAAFPDDAIVVLDGGNTAIWGSFFTEVRAPGTVLSTFKFGMLGAGLGQAIGAKVAAPGREVYCLIGDGAMGFHPQEVETAVRHGLKVVWLVVSDRQWGMVKMGQQFSLKPLKTLVFGSLAPGETINADLHETRWDEMARAMGARGERAATRAELEAAIDRARKHDGPTVIHCDVDPVKHMWAPGLKYFKDMHAEPGGSGKVYSC